MTSVEIRRKFLEFFSQKGHAIIPSASLVPENDPTTLFTTAGMQQFKKYYLNPSETENSRITTSQKCVRTGDIEEVGDDTHLTFFEMLGNFSFGYPNKAESYFKEDAIKYAWEFLTETLQIDKKRIYATYFEGNDDVPEDKESLDILKKINGLSEIKPQGFEDNFWSLGTENSPGGSTVEFYVDGIEIWNCVFNEYVFKNGKYELSENKGVDTGMGLERLVTVLQGKNSVYDTDLFEKIIFEINITITANSDTWSPEKIRKAERIIADHVKASVFLISDGVIPSNTGRGYVLRRLIRRATRYGKTLNLAPRAPSELAEVVIGIYKDVYPELAENKDKIFDELNKEEEKFGRTIEDGLRKSKKIFDQKTSLSDEKYVAIMQASNKKEIFKELYKDNGSEYALSELGKLNLDGKEVLLATVSGKEAFNLYQTYGFPIEMIVELVQEKNLFVDIESFEREVEKHQELSKTASAGMFKGGLADVGEMTTKYHTATHLLLAAMREVLGADTMQKGSNITAERMRFDFNCSEKLTDEQKQKIEDLVNEKIKENLPVVCEEMSKDEALKKVKISFDPSKYGDVVKVYTIDAPSNSSGHAFSVELCGGPHVASTGELGHFKITKEESSSAGVRRIKAVLN
jgi:alanyl-tRNA synthetase